MHAVQRTNATRSASGSGLQHPWHQRGAGLRAHQLEFAVLDQRGQAHAPLEQRGRRVQRIRVQIDDGQVLQPRQRAGLGHHQL